MSLADFKTGENGLNKLSASDFEMKIIFSLMNALQPKKTMMNIEEAPKVVTEAFSPTIKEPDIEIEDKQGRSFSFWYKPVIYYPKNEEAKTMIVGLVISKGKHKSLYEIDSATLKALKTHEFLTSSMIKELSMKLITKIKPVHVALFMKKNYTVKDLNEVKDASFYLRPSRLILASEEYVPENVKMNLPLNAYLIENVDMNAEKFKEAVKKLI